MKIWLWQMGECAGPFTPEQVAAMLADATISRTGTLASPDRNEWRPLEELIALRGRRAMKSRRAPGELPGWAAPAIFATFVHLLLVGFWDIRSSPYVRTADDLGACAIAQPFVREGYPAARTFRRFAPPAVSSAGNTDDVALRARGPNAFGGPLENPLGVEMTFDATTRRRVHVRQR